MAALDGLTPAIIGAANAGDSSYEIERSLRFNSADSAYLNRTPSSAGNRRTWTWSGWVKRSELAGNSFIFGAGSGIMVGGAHTAFMFTSDDKLQSYDYTGSGYAYNVVTEKLFRDPAAWYHIVLAIDTTQSTSTDRVKLYVNGELQTDLSTTSYPSLNYETYVNTSSIAHQIGHSNTDSFDGYLADVHFIDGQALAPSDFGEDDENNVWQPKQYEGGFDDWFNTSQTWSGLWSGSVGYGSFANLHDTNFTNYMQSLDATLTLSSPITVTSLRILLQRYGPTGTTLSINGTDESSQLPSAGSGIVWVDITGVTSLTSINVTSGDYSSNTLGLYAIEVNGKLLLDTGTSVSNNGFHLNFSDNSSNAALGTDSSGNNNTWTVNNIEASGAFGIGTACSILTTSQTISFPITYATTVTYEFFTKVTNAATYTYFAYENVANLWNLGINASGSLLFGNYNGGWTTFSSTGLNDGDWHFVRLTTTGSSTSLYIDGTLFGTNASGGSVSTGSEVTNELRGGAFRIAYLRITNGGTPPTTGIPALADMNQPAGSGGTLAFFDKLDDIASSGTKTSDGGNVTITMSAATVATDTSGTDSLIDSPTNYTAGSGNNGGNYCTFNLLKNQTQTLKNGNLESNGTSGRSTGTLYASSGKFYWEFTAGTDYTMSGIESSTSPYSASYPGENDQQYALYGNAGSGLLYHNGSTTSVDGFVSGDVIGVALDLDGGNLYFYKNGAAMNGGSAVATGLTGSWTANCRSGSGGYNGDTKFNFGQRPFAYTPPTGYVSLCTQNLADPTISDGTTATAVDLYTGTGSTLERSNFSFSPDLVWIKNRSSTYEHLWFDVVRGATNYIKSNSTALEQTNASTLSSFDSDGFTLGGDNEVNKSSETYVAWAWDAGTTTSTNNDGSTQSSVRVSTTNGFSIGTWTGNGAITTVGHGLGAVPGMAIIKKRNGTSPWYVWHQDLGGSGWNLQLNNDNARTNNSDVFSQGGLFNSSTIPLGAVGNVSGNNVFYAWSPVEGFSSFGQYTGNGNSDGPFVYTGFRVAWLMIKNRQTGGETWTLHDSTRDVDNPAEHRLLPSSNNAESTGTSARYKDLLSNGFKIRGTSGEQNTNGEIYIYAAFAENPFKTARAR